MPHSNTAEALPIEPHDEEIEDLTHEAKELPPPIPADAEIKRKLSESDEERRAKMEEARFQIEARKNIDELPDMTLEADLEDPKDREEHYKKLERRFEADRRILEARKKREAEEDAPSAFEGEPPASTKKRGFWGRVKGLFGGH